MEKDKEEATRPLSGISITLSKPRQYSFKPLLGLTHIVRMTYGGRRYRQEQTLNQRQQEEMEDRLWDLEWKKQANKVAKLRAENEERIWQKWELDQKNEEQSTRDKNKVSRERETWAKEQEIVRHYKSTTQAAEEMESTKEVEEETWETMEELSGQGESASQRTEEIARQREREEVKEKVIQNTIINQKELFLQKENAINDEMLKLIAIQRAEENMAQKERKEKAEAEAKAIYENIFKQKANVKEELARQEALQRAKQMAKQKEREESEEKAIHENTLRQKANALKKELARMKELQIAKEMTRQKEQEEAKAKTIQKKFFEQEESLTQKANATKEEMARPETNQEKLNVPHDNETSGMKKEIEKDAQENNKQERMEEVSIDKRILTKPAASKEDFFFRIGKYEHDDSLTYDFDGHGLRVPWE